MYLIDWFQANLMMAIMVLVLLGIPLMIGIIVFTKKSKKGKE